MKFKEPSFSIKLLPDISAIDWQKIMTLRSEVFVGEQKCIYTDPDSEDASAFHTYAVDKTELIGYARFFKKKRWHLGRIVVDQKHRGHGFSKQLIEASIKYIQSSDANFQLEISAQVYLSDFYTSLNFMPIGSMYLEDGIPHLRMILNH
jgi:ElaA protein